MLISKNKRTMTLIIVIFVLLVLSFCIAWDNSALELNSLTITSKDIPVAFDGFRIAHISDPHNAKFGDNNIQLIDLLQKAAPDIIVITGDLVDSRKTNISIALHFAEEAINIAPCYYVPGNHEARILEYDELKNGLMDLGVSVLENDALELTRTDDSVLLLGLQDPSFFTDHLFGDERAVTDRNLRSLMQDNHVYTILLSHRPELFDIYAKYDINLIFSGHAHGGQFRIPFIGGLAAPNQGLFPEYDAGMYTKGNTSMIVSRGIGDSVIPFRLNNPPEVILVELQKH